MPRRGNRSRAVEFYTGIDSFDEDENNVDNGYDDENAGDLMNTKHGVEKSVNSTKSIRKPASTPTKASDRYRRIRALFIIRRFIMRTVIRRRLFRLHKKQIYKSPPKRSKKIGRKLLKLYRLDKATAYEMIGLGSSRRKKLSSDDEPPIGTWVCENPRELETVYQDMARLNITRSSSDPLNSLTDYYNHHSCADGPNTRSFDDFVPMIREKSDANDEELLLEGKNMC